MSAPKKRAGGRPSTVIPSTESSSAASGRESSVRAESVASNESLSPFKPPVKKKNKVGGRGKAVGGGSAVAVRGRSGAKKRTAAEDSPVSPDDFQELSKGRRAPAQRGLLPQIAESEGCSSTDLHETVTVAAAGKRTAHPSAASSSEAAQPSQDAATDMQTQHSAAQAAASDMQFRASIRAHGQSRMLLFEACLWCPLCVQMCCLGRRHEQH